ncbi:MAG TPA: hypothetical protein VGJ91_11120, partial [Polyangiaceae bacterium]
SASAQAQQAPPPAPPPVAPPVAAAPPPAPPPPAAPPASPPTIQLVRPQEPPAAPPPKIDLSTEPVAAAVQRTYHFHEGFYLRASVGFGYYYGSFSDANRPNLDFNEHGGNMSLDLLIGGSPSPGVSIGGGLLVDPLFGAEYSRDGDQLGSHGGVSTLIGPFIDCFPDATKGWHLGGLIGFAGQSFQNVNASGDGRERAAGIGGAAWFGYDFWVAPEWAAGPQFRAMGARTSDTKSGENVSAFASSFDVGVSVVFN